MTNRSQRSGWGTEASRIFGKTVEFFHPARGYVPLLFLGFLLAIWLTKGMAESTGQMPLSGSKAVKTSAAKRVEKTTDIDALIDAYRQAPRGEKGLLMQRIRSRIVDQVTGEQQTTIAEVIRLKKLQAEEKRYARRHRQSSERTKKSQDKPGKKRTRSSRTCRGIECTFKRVKRSLKEFFRKATAKRRHPAKKPKAEEVLKGKVE